MIVLSIIVPVFKVEQTLERCLKSIAAQSFMDWEAILVDDGSPDNCPKICDEWAKRDSRFRVIHKSNGGLSDARNAGIEAAKGEYITFVDSDDFLEPSSYHHVMSCFTNTDIDIVEFPVYRFYGSRSQQLLSFPNKTYTNISDYWLNGKAYDHSYAWNKIYRRELFGNDIRFPIGRLFEDMATLPLLLKRARKIVTTDKGLYYYCANDNGITATASGEQLNMLLESHLDVIRQHPDYINDKQYYLHVLNLQIFVCQLTGQKARLPHKFVNPATTGLTMKQRFKALLQNIFGSRGVALLGMADTSFILFVSLLCSLPAFILFCCNSSLGILNPRIIAAILLTPMVPALIAWILSCVMARWPKTKRIVKAITYTVCIVLMAINLFLVLNFSTMLTPAMMMLVYETNGTETANFFSTYGLTGSSLIAYVLTLTAIIVAVKMKSRIHRILKRTALLLLIVFVGGTYQLWKTAQMFACITQYDMEIWFWNKGKYCINNTVSGMIYSYHMLHIIASENAKAMETNKLAFQQPASYTNVNDSLHIILVIGESYSKYHAGIYGYELDTTPMQQEALDRGQLFVFTDAVSPYNMTTLAVRNMLSTNSMSMGESWADKPLFPIIFKKADFHVMMWDNQIAQTGNATVQDFTLNSLLNNKDMRKMAYSQNNNEINDLDMPFVDSCLAVTNLQKHSHTLAIYHLVGQHFAARNHYPNDGSYDIFTYKDINRTDLSEGQRQEIAEYDNATRYNDEVIGHIMNYYQHQPAVMIYLSDHGEEVYDYRNLVGRTHETNKSPEALKYQYEIPMIVWCSDSFIQRYPEQINAIKDAKSKPFMSDNLPHMIFDLASIQTPYYNKQKDLLSPSYSCGTRLIQNNIDYDQVIKH